MRSTTCVRRTIRCGGWPTRRSPAGSRAGRWRRRFAVGDGEHGRASDPRRTRSTTRAGDLVGIMLIVRNLEYLSQVQSTLRYSRKLAALGRLSAGVAHEVKNPLNAMMIHLELLRQQFAPRRRRRRAARGVGAVAAEAPQSMRPRRSSTWT